MKKAVVCEVCAKGLENPMSIQKRNRWKVFFMNKSLKRIKLVCWRCKNVKEFDFR